MTQKVLLASRVTEGSLETPMTEADIAIAQDCMPGDLVVSLDSISTISVLSTISRMWCSVGNQSRSVRGTEDCIPKRLPQEPIVR